MSPVPYEWKCLDCGSRQEAHTSIACQVCGSDMKRVYSFMTTNMPTGGGTKMPRQTDR